MNKPNPATDAFRDMAYEGFYPGNSLCRHRSQFTINHILDPLIQYGFAPRRCFEEASGYISFQQNTAGCIGAIALGQDLEKKYPRRWSEGLMEELCERFDVDINYLEGVEAGFDGGTMPPSHLLNRMFSDGFKIGQLAWEVYLNPRAESPDGDAA